MPHMDAAYNLARWLAGNEPDAQDVVQDACLRAFRFFDGFHGGNSRSWLLRIVRNAFYDWLRQNRGGPATTQPDEFLHEIPEDKPGPDAALRDKVDHAVLHQAIAELPVEFREVLILRELERFSYKEISDVADLPIGTVMSRLARARAQLRLLLIPRLQTP